MNGITKPTQIELHYEYYGNNFLLYSLDHLYNNVPINKDDDEESTESDQHAEELLQEICNFARQNQNFNNQVEPQVGMYDWKQVASDTFARGKSVLVSYCLNFFTVLL
jgi:hypothetical protein